MPVISGDFKNFHSHATLPAINFAATVFRMKVKQLHRLFKISAVARERIR